MRLVEYFRFVQNQNSAFRVVEDRRLQWECQGQEERNAWKKLSAFGENTLFGELLLEHIIAPVLLRPRCPLTDHFATRKNILHGQDVDVLDRAPGSLIIKVELPDRIHRIAKKLHTNRRSHQWRKDIHDASANGKLPLAAHGLLPDIARDSEVFHQQLLGDVIAF